MNDMSANFPTEEARSHKDVNQSYKGFLWFGLICIFLLLGGAFFWAWVAQIQGAVIAPGRLVVESEPKIIQHLDGGIVGEVLVKDGDQVQQGEVLMRLDPTILEANRVIVETRYYETLARVVRLEAERDNLSSIDWPEVLQERADDPVVQRAMLDQEAAFSTRQSAAQGLVRQLNERIAQAENQILGLASLIDSQREQVRLLNGELDDLQRGLQKGVVARTRYNSVAREQSRVEGEMARNRTEIARLRNTIAETEVEILQARRDRQEKVLQELQQARTDSSDFREQLTSAADQRSRIEITSPDDGVVHNMQVKTVGRVVRPGEEIMSVIPQEDRLIIEAQVEPQDIDQVYEGQPATMRFSAFNQRRTPELNGYVWKMSPDSIFDPNTGIPYYSVRLTVPPEEMAYLEGLELIPGMPVEAFMQTEEKSVWEYLWKPASDAMRRTFREE